MGKKSAKKTSARRGRRAGPSITFTAVKTVKEASDDNPKVNAFDALVEGNVVMTLSREMKKLERPYPDDRVPNAEHGYKITNVAESQLSGLSDTDFPTAASNSKKLLGKLIRQEIKEGRYTVPGFEPKPEPEPEPEQETEPEAGTEDGAGEDGGAVPPAEMPEG